MKNLPEKLDPIGLKGCFIAGGAVLSVATRTDINDYDVYPKSNEAMIELFYNLFDANCFIVNVSDRAITFKWNDEVNKKGERMLIQVMTYDTFETAEKIFSNFDFTVCMGAFDCDAKQYILHDDFYPDIASKTLRFNMGTKFPLNSLLRIGKYIGKGFGIGKPEMIKIALAIIQEGMPTSWEDLESAIGGSYGREIKLARGELDYSFEAAIELLSNIRDLDLMLDDNDFSSMKPEELEDLFSDSQKLVAVNSSGEYFVIDKDTNIPIRELGTAKPKNFVLIEKDVSLYGYKVLVEGKDGSLLPGVYTHSKTRYNIGQETEELKSPFLYVFPTYDKAKTRTGSNFDGKPRQIYKVSYSPSDLRKVSSDEIQVTKLYVIGEVENMKKQEVGDSDNLYKAILGET